MNKRQTRKLNMAITVLDNMDTNQSLWNTVPAISPKVESLRTITNRILQLEQTQQNDITGNREGKERKLATLAAKAIAIAKPLACFARDSENQTLLAEIDFELTHILQTKDLTAIDRSRTILDKATQHKTELIPYGITQAILDELEDAIDQFSQVMTTPRVARTLTKTATHAIKAEAGKLDTTLITLDQILTPFRTTKKTFYNTYINARQIIDTGSRNIMLRGKITDARTGIPIPGVIITIKRQGFRKTITSSKRGHYRFQMLHTSTYRITFVKDGYQTITDNNVGINAAKTLTLNFIMTVS